MTTDETIRSQQQMGVWQPPTFHEMLRHELDRGAESIVIQHHGGTVTLTPEQGRKVLAGRELTVVLGKVVVK